MNHHRFDIEGGVVEVRCTDQSDGSFALDQPSGELGVRRARVLGSRDRRWISLLQVHGAAVYEPSTSEVAATSRPGEPPRADAAVSFDSGIGVSVLTADCAPLVLIGTTGVAVVHAGWRGAAAGVVEAASARLRAGGARPVATLLGPCIQPAAYEFGADDLDPIVSEFGPEVVGRTAAGTTALDLTRVVQLCCARAGWPVPERPACTSAPRYFSHRTRGDRGRQATVAWIEMEDV